MDAQQESFDDCLNPEWLWKQFPIKRTRAYFNNASYTPMSKDAIEAIFSAIKEYSQRGPDDEFYREFKAKSNECRKKLADIINSGNPECIVFTESATQSINLVANGFKFSRGDSVVIRGGPSEHPSNYIPWIYYARAKGVNIYSLKTDDIGLPDLSELDSVLKEARSRLVVVSHVLYNYGTILPAREIGSIAHERGALFFLDISQSVGNIDVDIRSIDCDFAAGTAAKWLCGPLGLGFLYCKEESLNLLEPLNFGPNSCSYDFSGSYSELGLPPATRLQEGFRNWAYLYGLSAAIDLLELFGLANVRRKNLLLSKMIAEQILDGTKEFSLISSLEDNLRTCILAFDTGRYKPIEIVQSLSKGGITVAEREIGKRKFLRISPHFYNDEKEVSHLVNQLTQMVRLL